MPASQTAAAGERAFLRSSLAVGAPQIGAFEPRARHVGVTQAARLKYGVPEVATPQVGLGEVQPLERHVAERT